VRRHQLLHPDHHEPFGIASFRIANYALWPFGRTTCGTPRPARLRVGNVSG